MKMSYTAKQARMNRAVALGFNCSSDNEYRVNKKMMSNQNQCDDDDDVRINWAILTMRSETTKEPTVAMIGINILAEEVVSNL